MILFVKSRPGENLVVGRRGRLVDRGPAGSAVLWPGSSYARVSAAKQEADFAMTQETSDGIPLRFKGIALYRVVDAVAAASQFDFVAGDGHAAIREMIAHVALGELRAAVAHMTMQECIEQRKTTLTGVVERELRDRADGGSGTGWGIELEVVQVAQVFIVDEDLRRQLESETRDRIRSESELSRIRTEERLRLAASASARALRQEELVAAREKNEIEREKIRLERRRQEEEIEAEGPVRLRRIQGEETVKRAEIESRGKIREEELALERRENEANRERARLEQELARERIEASTPVRRLRIESRREETAELRALRDLEREVEGIRVERDLAEDRARQALRLELLSATQVTEVAGRLAEMLRGANLTLYGEGAGPLAGVEPIVDFLAGKVRNAIVGGHGESGPPAS